MSMVKKTLNLMVALYMTITVTSSIFLKSINFVSFETASTIITASNLWRHIRTSWELNSMHVLDAPT